MRIAILADIHGNLRALTAVFADIERRGADLIFNLGDCLSGPLQAAETADVLIERNLPTVRGNHDRQLVDRPVEKMGLSDRQAAWQIREDHWPWLRGLPATKSMEGILLCHGIPSSDLVYCLETVTANGVTLASDSDIEGHLGNPPEAVILCGHSHVPRVVRTRAGRLVVNPGSVGLQAYKDSDPCAHKMETGSPHTRYALIEGVGDDWSVEFRIIVYDWNSAARDAAAAGRSDWAHALRTGYAVPE
jgi:putative phosphoesterase